MDGYFGYVKGFSTHHLKEKGKERQVHLVSATQIGICTNGGSALTYEECRQLIVNYVQREKRSERISGRDSWERSRRKLDELPADRAATLHELSLGVKSMMGFLRRVTGS